MLTDTELRNTHRFHGRRDTVTFGSEGLTVLSLARAREKIIDAKRMIAEGVSLLWKSSAP